MGNQQELFEPGEYLDYSGPGYFSICAKPEGQWTQKSYELQHLPTVVNGLNPYHDTWISQAIFRQPNRRAVNVQSVGLLFSDLDTYRNIKLAAQPPEEQVEGLLRYCADQGLPPPSVVLFSGRGLQGKWLLDSGLGPSSLFEWQEAENALVRILEPFCADAAAKDVSRVLRLDRTVNTKSGEMVRIVHVTGVPDAVARYSFEDLRRILVPRAQREEPAPEAVHGKIIRAPASLGLKKLNWYRLYDIRDLWRRRGGVPEGHRETTLFWELNFLLLAEPGRMADLWKEAEALASEIDAGGGWYRNSDLGSLYRRAMEARSGAKVAFQGRTHPPGYTPRNQTLLEVFRVTPEEERGLRTIISATEKYRRVVERRRAAGMVTRAEYLENALANQRPWEALGISRAWWYRTAGRTRE
jgi:hypothetical protein